MIIEIFITLLVITLSLILLGSYFEISAITIMGLTFLFLLGVVILNPLGSSGIEYQTGNIINETSSTISVVTHTYSTYTDKTIGIFLCSISMLWFVITFINIRRENQDEN